MQETATKPTVREQLAALRAAAEKRKQAIDEETDRIEVEELTLDEEYSAKLGTRGRDYEIIPTLFGVFAFKKPEELAYKKASLKITEGKTADAHIHVHQLLATCLLHPSQQEFGKHMAERPGLGGTLLGAVSKLAGVQEAERRSKF